MRKRHALSKPSLHHIIAFILFDFVVTLPKRSINATCGQRNLRSSPIISESTATKQTPIPYVTHIISVQQPGKAGTATIAMCDTLDDQIIKIPLTQESGQV